MVDFRMIVLLLSSSMVLMGGADDGTNQDPKVIVFTMLVSDDHEAHRNLNRVAAFDGKRPDWLNTTIENNVDHCRRFGREFVVREFPPAPLLEFQKKRAISGCVHEETEEKREECKWKNLANSHREQANWLKLKVLLDYCNENDADYFMFLDADVVLHTRKGHDPVKRFIGEMNQYGVDIQWADEDWQGKSGQLNGGVILVRNCEWSKFYLATLLDDHLTGRYGCGANEQICMRGSTQNGGREGLNMSEHARVASGIIFNTHPNYQDLNSEDVGEIVHWMGGAKGGLQGVDLVTQGQCPDDMCLHVEHCGWRYANPKTGVEETFFGGRSALVWLDALQEPPGERFIKYHKTMKFAKSKAKKFGLSFVMIVPKKVDAINPLTTDELSLFKEHGIQLLEADFLVPPGSSLPSSTCHPEKYLILHAFKLIKFRSVIILNKEHAILEDIHRGIVCASKAQFLATTGVSSPLSSDVVLLKPSETLYKAAVDFATSVQLVGKNSWKGEDSVQGTFADADCAAGFLYAFMYSQQYASIAHEAFIKNGFKQEKHYPNARIRHHYLDRCIWNRSPGDTECTSTCAESKIASSHVCRL